METLSIASGNVHEASASCVGLCWEPEVQKERVLPQGADFTWSGALGHSEEYGRSRIGLYAGLSRDGPVQIPFGHLCQLLIPLLGRRTPDRKDHQQG